LTIISNSPHLQVLGHKGSVMVANIDGSDNPVAMLDNKIIDLLSIQCRNAKAESLKSGGNVNAALELCATLDGVLKTCAHIRDEYYDRIDIERERAEAESRLLDASSALQKPL
jgi:hypothetical protein